jgi:hypothetical protein
MGGFLGNLSTVSDTTRIYDIATNTWTTGKPVPATLGALWLAVGLNIVGMRTGRWLQNLGALATCLYLISFSDLAFAWRACRWVKSNAILLASGRASVGIGMGQVNRVDSARIAVTVRFEPLTRRYHVTLLQDGRVAEERTTDHVEDMRRWVSVFDRLPLFTTRELQEHTSYDVRVRGRTSPRHTWSFWPWARPSAHGSAGFTFLP